MFLCYYILIVAILIINVILKLNYCILCPPLVVLHLLANLNIIVCTIKAVDSIIYITSHWFPTQLSVSCINLIFEFKMVISTCDYLYSFLFFQGANASNLEKEIGSDQFPTNEHYFGLVNVSQIAYFTFVIETVFFSFLLEKSNVAVDICFLLENIIILSDCNNIYHVVTIEAIQNVELSFYKVELCTVCITLGFRACSLQGTSINITISYYISIYLTRSGLFHL